MSGWSCPHQTGDYFCQRVNMDCVPGMKGCVLRGKVHFAKDEEAHPAPAPERGAGKGTAKMEGEGFDLNRGSPSFSRTEISVSKRPKTKSRKDPKCR